MPWNKDYDNHALTELEALAIITKAAQLAPDTFSKYRNHWAPLFATLWYTGKRVGMILALTPPDVALGEITYTPSKRKAPRASKSPIPWETSIQLQGIARGLKSTARIFPMSKQGVDKALKRIAIAAGISRHVHAHMFRHGHGQHLADDMKRKGYTQIEIEGAVKNALDHVSWQSSRPYLEPTGDQLAQYQRDAFERR